MKPLAVLYRPQTFEDVVEQDTIKKILQNQINTGTVKNAYLFCGSAGCGKAQPLSSLVLTPNGFIPMGNVVVGTHIFTRNGNIAVVSGVFPQGVRDVYEITFSDRTKIRVADNHLNHVFRYNQSKKCREDYILETDELIDLFNKSKYKLRVDLPTVEFSKQDVPLDPYLLGCLIGDGALRGNTSFSNTEQDVLDRVGECLSKYDCMLVQQSSCDYRITRTTDGYRHIYTYDGVNYSGEESLAKHLHELGYPKFCVDTIYNLSNNDAPTILSNYPELKSSITRVDNDNYSQKNTITRIIHEIGLDVTSESKFIPKEYLYNDEETRLALLRGLFDTDGYTSENGATEYVTCSKQLSDDFAFLVRSLGCRDTVSEKETAYTNESGERVSCKKAYRHHIKFRNDLIYCSSEKHLSKRRIRQNDPIKNIVSIKKVESDVCQCIYVDDPDHTYLSNDFIPTHNTTNAYLFAKCLNECSDNITDLDAASHSSVDDVRNIIEDSRYKPIGTPYRIFIIDEAHALSDKAWQAFLLTLEDPTPSSVFIFCTTNPEKIPATILSRAQRFDFQKITQSGIVNRLKYIIECENENGSCYTYTDDALEYIAKLSEGGMRSAITFMETALGLSKDITIESVVSALGTISYRTMFDLTKAVCEMNKKSTISIIEKAYASGTDIKRFVRDFTDFVLDLCKYDLFRDFEWIHIPPTYRDDLESFSKDDYVFFTQLLNEMLNLNNTIKWDPTPKPTVESVFILLCSEA